MKIVEQSGVGFVGFAWRDQSFIQRLLLSTSLAGLVMLSVASPSRAAGSWTEAAALPVIRSSPAAAVLNGALYAIGGEAVGARSNVYCFNGTNWTEVASLPAARTKLAAAVHSNAIYAMGGEGSYSNVYRYDGTNWTEVASLPAVNYSLAAAELDGVLYAIGGSSRSNVYRFTGTNWMAAAGLPKKRGGAAAAVLGGAIYSVGGNANDGSGSQSNVYAFNGATWTEIAPLPAARDSLAVGVLNGSIYAVGGYEDGATNTVYRYYGSSWTQVNNLPSKRAYIAAGVLNDKLYVMGGGDSNVYCYNEDLGLCVLGTNSAVIASGDPANAEKGTDFGSAIWTAPRTNAFSMINTGAGPLTVSAVLTNGAGAAAFRVNTSGQIAAGATSALSLVFAPSAAQTFTAQVSIVNNGAQNPFVLNLSGAGLKSDQVITFPAIAGQVVTGSVGLSATASSGLPVTFALAAGPGSISGGTNLSFTGTGAVSVTASQAGNTNWNAAANVTRTCTVSRANQTIAFPAIAGQVVTGSVGLSATASSGLPVTFALAAGPGSISGGTNLSFTATGAVSVTASQAGNTNWNAAANVTRTVAVAKASQSITFPAIADQVVTGRVGLSATASSGLPVAFAVASGPGQIGGGTNLSFTATGAVSVTASQAGNANWNAAANVTRSLTVTKANQTIAFPAIADQVVTGAVDLSATASSGLPVAFTVASGPGQISGSALSFSGTGRVSVSASQAGNASYEPAASVVNTLNVLEAVAVLAADFDGDGRADPTLYFTSTGRWLIRLSTRGYAAVPVSDFGGLAYAASAGDIDGDRLADPIIYNPASKRFTAMLSGSGYPRVSVAGLGDTGYQPVRGDFDGDRKADPAVFQVVSGTFAVRLSASGYAAASVSGFGAEGYSPVDGDFDGDGKADLVIYHCANGNWFVKLSSAGYLVYEIAGFGGPAYATVSGDFDGDGKADPALYHAGTGAWDIELSSQSYLIYTLTGLGSSSMVAVAGDFDGDGKADPAVYNTASGLLTVKCSTMGYAAASLPLWP